MGFSLSFQRNHPDRRFSSMIGQSTCSCGKGYQCLRKCKGFEVWMSGTKNRVSSARSFLLTSNKSFSVAVTVFGFTIMASLRILQGGTICFYNGLKSMSDILNSYNSKEKSMSTWLRVKLTLVVSVSFILSVAVLGTLMSVVLYLLTRLVRLKRNFLVFSRRLVKTLRKTSL